ncbi:facilitated trehalose transporter Tret1-2 homolog isoform X1 [Diaphorina citri]|jgi:Arabinose efflux permease|uniref:Facilitated trehalose transporter Tret1-2 homolog isoform X1 n=2 Tax=Diaphorina citri TaxID=121845 RepID=A0A3Q0IJ59_DIACI|nr:facilitated trehalose transporter Tret1-2 homolog isoform X1 [Diaphorina citri]
MFIIIIVSVNICSVAYGIFLGWPSVVQPMLQSDKPPVGSQPFSNNVISWLGALPFISSMLGNLFWGRVADKFGRKVTGYVSIMPNITCYVLMLSTDNQTVFMVARFLGGFTNSAVASNTPMYIGEISELHLRGKLASLYMLFANIGVLFVYVLGSFVTFHTLNRLCLGVSVLYLVLFFFLPESPVCLLKMNKTDKARKCVIWYRGEDEEYVNAELKRFNDSFVRAKKFSLKHLLKKTTLKGIIIGLGLQAGIQLSGISIVLTYTVYIFKQSGSQLSPNMCTIIVGGLELIGSIFSSTFIEMAGRKKILCATYFVMMIALCALGTCFYLQSMHLDINLGYIPLISLSSYMLAYPFGAGTIPYVMYSELFASEVKNIALSFIILWNNFLAFCTVKVFPTIFMEILHLYGCFWFFSFCTLMAMIFVIFVVPETKDRSLLTVLQKLNGGKPLKEKSDPSLHTAENGPHIENPELTSPVKVNGVVKFQEDEKVKENGDTSISVENSKTLKTSENSTVEKPEDVEPIKRVQVLESTENPAQKVQFKNDETLTKSLKTPEKSSTLETSIATGSTENFTPKVAFKNDETLKTAEESSTLETSISTGDQQKISPQR